MTEGIEHQYFERIAEYPVAVCKECRYAVWPNQIEGHLRKLHKQPLRRAKTIANAIQQWANLLQQPSQLERIINRIDAIPQLPVYDDGMLCLLDTEHCQHIARTLDSIKLHWRNRHDGWSVGKKRGRPGDCREKRLQEHLQRSYRRVYCQRLFGSRHGSQYFEVRNVPKTSQLPVPTEDDAAWAQVGLEMAKVWREVESRAIDTIQDGEKDEASPWLDRTGWAQYLKNLERAELLASVEQPNADPDKAEEPVENAIWLAMDGLARVSQLSVIHRTGIFVRLEIIRTEIQQTEYTPLQAYMDDTSIKERSRPWKQMLMFFARTQREHSWNSPKYKFTRQQRDAWLHLVEQTKKDINGVEEAAEEMDFDNTEMFAEHVDGQQQSSNNVEERKEAKLNAMEKACLKFCIALLNQTIRRKEYDCALVCALAVLGVKEDGWKGHELYPPILSSVIKVARFMVVQEALELSEPFKDDEFDDESAHDSNADLGVGQSQPKGCLEFVQKMVNQFMVRGSHSPMQWMLDLRTYGLKIHYNTTSQGHVEWMGGDELLYKNLHFTMAQFRAMVHGLQAESQRLLIEELLFCNEKTGNKIPSIPWDQLRDNPTDNRPGWSFLHDQRTRLPVKGDRWLFESVGRDVSLRERFMKSSTSSGMERQAVEWYMDRVIAFREKLIVLMHVTAGQPARATELLSIRHSNTVKGGHRNIFIEDGMVVFVTRYHKGYAVSGDVKIIHRYLPREVGELLVLYLWLVLPFQQRLEAMVWKKKVISSHLWPADPNGRKWTSERMRKTLKRESRIRLGQEITIAGYREIAIGISRRFLRGSTAFSTMNDEENEAWEEENAAGRIADEQAGHTSHVAGMVYARGIMEQAGVVAERRQQFRSSSTDWHRFLGFTSAVEEAKSYKKRKMAPYETQAEEARIERLQRLSSMDSVGQLKRIKGNKAKFRGSQRKAIDAIVAGHSPIIAIMATGAGKSMLFMLPAWAEQAGTTIVVVPLISLRGDMMRRCKELGISCAEWQSQKPADAAAIVFVTPESAVGEGFATFINRLRATRQLDRIVIDECHIVLNGQYKFRKQMQQLGKLVAAETQMVLLTATLPPTEEDELYRRMYFNRSKVYMFRDATTRTNIAYQCMEIENSAKKKEVERMMVKIVQRKMKKYKSGRIIVYGNSKAKVEAIARQLDCLAYHADAVGKASMLADFMARKERVIVATSALGMGVDIADVRCIIHMDWPFSMLDYAQESGRAGRDNLRSEAILIVQQGQQRIDDKKQEADQGLVREYVQGQGDKVGCRRIVLDGYLDGNKSRSGCKDDESEQMCDVCCGMNGQVLQAEEDGEDINEEESEEEDCESNMEVDARERDGEEMREVFQQQEQVRRGPWETMKEQEQQEYGNIEWLSRQLAWWANRCAICETADEGQSGHDIGQCGREESAAAKEMMAKVEKKIKFAPYSGCFWCGVPQELCNRWEDNGQGRYQRAQGGDCQYKGVLISSTMGLLFGGKEDVVKRWCKRLEEEGIEVESIDELIEYLGGKQKLDKTESNNLVKEFCWMTKLLAE